MARDFKSVGIKLGSDLQDRVATAVSPPVGIATPLTLSTENMGLLTMHYDLSDQIIDNLRSLVMTNHGERVGVYDLGANLQPLTLELSQPVWEEEAMIRIKTAVAKFMPYVDLQTFEVVMLGSDDRGMGKVAIRMTYTVQGVQERPRAVEIIMYIAG